MALRYGYFYGPGTAISSTGSTGQDVARRRLPVIGGGTGVWSLIHVRDAAAATVAALTSGASGAYNIVDDEPARVSEWIPALAEALGARPPRRIPALIARPLAGAYGIAAMTRAQGADNAKARRELGWEPRVPELAPRFRGGSRVAAGLPADDQQHPRHEQHQPQDPPRPDRGLRDPQQPEAVDHDRDHHLSR